MARCILGNVRKGFFNPCRICKSKDKDGLVACFCTKGFLEVLCKNIKESIRRSKYDRT